MNRRQIAVAIATALVLGIISFSSAVLHAGGWDNFKLRYFSLTQVFHNSDREFQDLEARAVSPEDNSRINLDELLNGGPPKDGIPSIDNPQFDTADTTPFPGEEQVIGIVINGQARAYPYGILNWHEIVNDSIGDTNITLTYCPLCDTTLAVERGDTTFGVSGKLYQSCLVMYDRSDDTLYSQPWGLGVVGPNVNTVLDPLPIIKTTLGNWLDQYPDSDILSTDTGYSRDYSRYPYGTYSTDPRIIFPVRDQELLAGTDPKEIVSYIWSANDETPHNRFSGEALAFSHEEIRELGEMEVEFDGDMAIARWDEDFNSVIVERPNGDVIPSSPAYAFVYPAFFGEGIHRSN